MLLLRANGKYPLVSKYSNSRETFKLAVVQKPTNLFK